MSKKKKANKVNNSNYVSTQAERNTAELNSVKAARNIAIRERNSAIEAQGIAIEARNIAIGLLGSYFKEYEVQKDAKNEAYAFISKKGLTDEFVEFCRQNSYNEYAINELCFEMRGEK
jgi:hypothetical protein